MRILKFFTDDVRGPKEWVADSNPEIPPIAYPKDYDSIFTFRIDCDNYHKLDYATTLNLCLKHSIVAAWFINTKTIPKSFIKKLIKAGQEVYPHCYEHKVFDTYNDNFDNLVKAEEVLLRILGEPTEIQISGTAAPSGKSNPEFIKAVEDMAYDFSSEFSVAYDTFPFKVGTVWQVPIHPICVGLGSWTKKDEKAGLDYFLNLINEKIKNRQLLFLYGHPEKRIGKYPAITDRIFAVINSDPRILKTRWSHFIQWQTDKEKNGA